VTRDGYLVLHAYNASSLLISDKSRWWQIWWKMQGFKGIAGERSAL
jgi:hypothetical protein